LLSSQSNVSTLPSSPLLDRKIEETTTTLPAHCAKQLHSIGEVNAAIIVEYIASMKSEVNLSDHYRRDVIVTLYRFSKYSNDKPFKDLTRPDVIAFLDRPTPWTITQMDRHLQHLQRAFTAFF
jgi:hypothetical protein